MAQRFFPGIRAVILVACSTSAASAAIITDPNDPRMWQGATVGTFAQLYFGSDTPATRQMVVDQQLLDDGLFSPLNYTLASLVSTPWTLAGNGSPGISFDLTGTGSYDYGSAGVDVFTAANTIDNIWFQSSGAVGDTVFDFGADVLNAAVFPVIDHGPLPQESIESTIYLSNDRVTWTEAHVLRVFLEGFQPNLGILWDGFTYVVGTGTDETFRYASVIHGGPGALIDDGDDEINGMLGFNDVPAPSGAALLILSMAPCLRRRR